VRLAASIFFAGALATLLPAWENALGQTVTIEDSASAFTLSNGIVIARVSKRTGDLTSFLYKGTETLNDRSGHAGGYWSRDMAGGKETIARVTIDPSANGGARGEVSVKGMSGGVKMGHGPGAAQGGDFPADIETRYALGGGDSGVYTYCTLEHLPNYPAAAMTEARYCAKLADTFDWMTIDVRRNRSFPADLHEGDKYIYKAVQFDHPVYGWSSTTKSLGFWLINPSLEYLSGGLTKVEFLCHRDTTQVAAACVRNYWRSSHYGGAGVAVGEGEHWTKVVGPFFLYVNSVGQMGEDAVTLLFPRDHTHTSDDGAKLNAALVVTGLKGLRDQTLIRGLSAAGRTVRTAPPGNVWVGRPRPARGPGASPADFPHWLNLPEPGDPSLPSLFLIGDSTVRNGRGDGGDGQFG
jgi:rhamnogalacturonan endolyase